ncbi:hypothetical protein CSB11_02690 [Candidatus Campbellbacteria bacterium]|nr:MAG: hypothetical protein CSB11_02690 [Candidatus Campbellbacteria bacterium]
MKEIKVFILTSNPDSKFLLETVEKFEFVSELQIVHRDKIFMGEISNADGVMIITSEPECFKQAILEVEEFCKDNQTIFNFIDASLSKDCSSEGEYDIEKVIHEFLYRFMIKVLLGKYYS